MQKAGGIIAIIAGVLGVFAAAPAFAQSMERMMLSHELGSVLAAEAFCDLTYNQDAIAAFIEDKVPADDMGFAGSLNMQVMGLEIMQNDMSASSKTAHCAQIGRVARSYGFVD